MVQAFLTLPLVETTSIGAFENNNSLSCHHITRDRVREEVDFLCFS